MDELLRRRAMDGLAETTEEKHYLLCSTDPGNGTQTNFITLPFQRSSKPRVVMDFYFTKKDDKYRYLLCWGEISQTRSLCPAYANGTFLYRGNWTYSRCDYNKGDTIVGAEINFRTRQWSMTKLDGTVISVADSTGWASANNAPFKLPLSKLGASGATIYQHSVKAYDSTTDELLYDLKAGLDGDGKACLIDQLTGTCYYDDLGEAYLVTL